MTQRNETTRLLSHQDEEREARDVQSSHGHSSHRNARLAARSVLDSRPCHYGVICLVVIDLAIIFAELLIELSRLSLVCERRNAGLPLKDVPGLRRAKDALAIVSLIFSCAFMVELLISLWAFGAGYVATIYYLSISTIRQIAHLYIAVLVANLHVNWWRQVAFRSIPTSSLLIQGATNYRVCRFFHSTFRIFDGAVIIIGFLVDVASPGLIDELGPFVLVLRLWRIVKVIGELSAQAAEQVGDLNEKITRLQEENSQLKRRYQTQTGGS